MARLLAEVLKIQPCNAAVAFNEGMHGIQFVDVMSAALGELVDIRFSQKAVALKRRANCIFKIRFKVLGSGEACRVATCGVRAYLASPLVQIAQQVLVDLLQFRKIELFK